MNVLSIFNSKKSQLLLIIFFIGWSVFMTGLNRIPVPTVDGVIRATEARFIIETGQWFPIQNIEGIITDHPPLYVWLSALSMKVFGVTDFAANFAQHIFAVGCVFITGCLALELGLSFWGILFSILILCSTRDFVLSSVRGYIEPILSFWIYSAYYFILKGIHKNKTAWIEFSISGIFVWLAVFSKGPPALWPLLFFVVYILKHRAKSLLPFLSGIIACSLLFVVWTDHNGFWKYWKPYFVDQVLNSAMKGRDGAQGLEPFYFISQLIQYYHPWLLVLIAALMYHFRNFNWFKKNNFLDPVWILIFGLGFIGGFSLVKWKFWYYIAPAFPAFSIFIASVLSPILESKLSEVVFKKILIALSFCWFLIASIFPIPLHLERAQEVLDFKDEILNSNIEGPVWFIHCLRDHNIVGSSGRWYFHRDVIKISDADEEAWAKTKLNKKSWIILDLAHYRYCTSTEAPVFMKNWCEKVKIIKTSINQKTGDVALGLFEP